MNYVAVSGGADSTAMALLLHERGEEFEMVFSDTGAELPETYWILPRLAQAVQKPLHVVANNTFFAWLVQFGFMLPSAQRRWCTRELKMTPQDRFFKAHNARTVAVGIRVDEVHRADLNKRGEWEWRYPLVDAGMDRATVHDLCRKHGLLSPAYEWRTNTSCFCCPFQRKRDWLGLLRTHPDLYALAEDWERQSIEQAQAKGWTPYGWSQTYRLQRLRQATEEQLSLWPECTEEACVICTT